MKQDLTYLEELVLELDPVQAQRVEAAMKEGGPEAAAAPT